MKSLLFGNGVNIQFGGHAYSSEFIMKRIRFNILLDRYQELFQDSISADEIKRVLDGLVQLANEIINNACDCYVKDDETGKALEDFRSRYENEVHKIHEVMLEDWFFLIHMFFLKNPYLSSNIDATKQGFERLILDGIYNSGKINTLYRKMNKKFQTFVLGFDNVFTLNYDQNIEKITGRPVYHLHGSFSELANSENIKNILGYIRNKKGERVVIQGFDHCFCNALLNYSGMLKREEVRRCNQSIQEGEKLYSSITTSNNIEDELKKLQKLQPMVYEMIKTKIEHPELRFNTEYYFDKFSEIEGDLHIIGMSPNNDNHIFKCIDDNKKISKVYIYCFSEKEKKYIDENFETEKYQSMDINMLWKSLRCFPKQYDCNYKFPTGCENILEALNALSDDPISVDLIKKEVNRIPQFRQKELCQMIDEDRQARNLGEKAVKEKEFNDERFSISLIALQEGILPAVLYAVYLIQISSDNKKK